VLVRDYGSDLFSLVDNPRDDLTRLRIIAATASALARWEPRLRVTRVIVSFPADETGLCRGYRGDQQREQSSRQHRRYTNLWQVVMT
jgi:phage baseplate assembly protein W